MRRVARPRGITLTELLVALTLSAIVGTAAVRFLIAHQRAYRAISGRLRANATLRGVATMLPMELRELSPAGPSPDLLSIGPTALTYRAYRSLYFVCRTDPAIRRISLDVTHVYGLRRLDIARDSILVFIENDPATSGDDEWRRANPVAAAGGTGCPGGRDSYDVTVDGIPWSVLTAIEPGAPARGFQVTELRLYADAGAARWIGMRTRRKETGWTVTQPIVGPVSVDGLVFVYHDAAGAVTSDPGRVARISIAVTAAGSGSAGVAPGLETQVALRNAR